MDIFGFTFSKPVHLKDGQSLTITLSSQGPPKWEHKEYAAGFVSLAKDQEQDVERTMCVGPASAGDLAINVSKAEWDRRGEDTKILNWMQANRDSIYLKWPLEDAPDLRKMIKSRMSDEKKWFKRGCDATD